MKSLLKMAFGYERDTYLALQGNIIKFYKNLLIFIAELGELCMNYNNKK